MTDREALCAVDHGVASRWTQLSELKGAGEDAESTPALGSSLLPRPRLLAGTAVTVTSRGQAGGHPAARPWLSPEERAPEVPAWPVSALTWK